MSALFWDVSPGADGVVRAIPSRDPINAVVQAAKAARSALSGQTEHRALCARIGRFYKSIGKLRVFPCTANADADRDRIRLEGVHPCIERLVVAMEATGYAHFVPAVLHGNIGSAEGSTAQVAIRKTPTFLQPRLPTPSSEPGDVAESEFRSPQRGLVPAVAPSPSLSPAFAGRSGGKQRNRSPSPTLHPYGTQKEGHASTTTADLDDVLNSITSSPKSTGLFENPRRVSPAPGISRPRPVSDSPPPPPFDDDDDPRGPVPPFDIDDDSRGLVTLRTPLQFQSGVYEWPGLEERKYIAVIARGDTTCKLWLFLDEPGRRDKQPDLPEWAKSFFRVRGYPGSRGAPLERQDQTNANPFPKPHFVQRKPKPNPLGAEYFTDPLSDGKKQDPGIFLSRSDLNLLMPAV